MRPYPLSDDLWLLDCAAFLPGHKTLVVSDLQLGAEGQLRRLGHNVRYTDENAMRELLDRQLTQTGATRIIINGDLKHEFGRISMQEREAVLRLLRWLQKRAELAIVRGNHDTITKPLLDELGVALHDAYRCGDTLCIHGHEAPSPDALRDARTIIIGHMHPAVEITDGVRSERCKCFLAGTYARRRLLVLPSLSRLTEGANVLSAPPNTPLLSSRGLARCEVYAVADEIRSFGTVGELRALMSR
jgi:putative SbcD/Mre11-related phosphoesterase